MSERVSKEAKSREAMVTLLNRLTSERDELRDRLRRQKLCGDFDAHLLSDSLHSTEQVQNALAAELMRARQVISHLENSLIHGLTAPPPACQICGTLPNRLPGRVGEYHVALMNPRRLQRTDLG